MEFELREVGGKIGVFIQGVHKYSFNTSNVTEICKVQRLEKVGDTPPVSDITLFKNTKIQYEDGSEEYLFRINPDRSYYVWNSDKTDLILRPYRRFKIIIEKDV